MIFNLIVKPNNEGNMLAYNIMDRYGVKYKNFYRGEISIFGIEKEKRLCHVYTYYGKRKIFNELKELGFKEISKQNGIRTLIP